MDPVVQLPDAELVLVYALSELLDSGYFVTWERPSESALDTILVSKVVVLVSRIGGITQYRKSTDRPTIDFDVMSLTRTQVSDGVREVRATVESLLNTVWPTAVIAGTYETAGPSARSEGNPSIFRYGFTYDFVIRPS